MLTLTNDLIKEYEKLVYSIVNNYANESNRDDLFQEGLMGLLDASRRFDTSLETKFSTYAYMHILGRVLKAVREDRNLKISRDLISDYKKIELVKERYYMSKGKIPSNEEIGKILNITDKRIEEVLRYNEKEVSLNKTINNDEKELTLEDIIYNKEEMDEIDRIDLKDAIKNLSIDEKRLIYERYYENKTQTELAKENNMSQVKVYRLERKILDKLKSKIE